ncbi:phage major capsid protein [Clostridium niameyense]|uniref:Phage major capsid protein n=1 Tax=Clostridium niameyense TaxID=1622073 RepID=A0A6M0RCI4_9CLOT|nr:phage major capsid protein [Clostridium niameyense]NEZ47934.1 phage major capsid protein [Clostridium niameyense]
MNLWKMKQTLDGIGKDLQDETSKLNEMYADHKADVEARNNQKSIVTDLKERFEGMKAQIEQEEAEAQAKIHQQQRVNDAKKSKDNIVAAKAEFIRNVINKQPQSSEILDSLKSTGTATNGGENFLPTTMVNDLISEPLTKNQLREIMSLSNISGLEIPKIAFKIDDDDFIDDDKTAKEIKATGDKVSFGKHKFKVFASISDSVLHGSDSDLTSYTENALRSGLAAKEKKCSLSSSPKKDEEHMSFYSKENAIEKITGKDLFTAITSAIADLHEEYRENATVVMSYTDYVKIMRDLSNGTMDLYKAQPEQIIGKPVIFCDSAKTPIIGDFNYAKINYDGDFIYDTDKDVKTGEYLFVLTAWIDIQILLKSAFRLATVSGSPS